MPHRLLAMRRVADLPATVYRRTLRECEGREMSWSITEDRDRWKHLARHLCFVAGHGPHHLHGDINRCGRCEGRTTKYRLTSTTSNCASVRGAR